MRIIAFDAETHLIRPGMLFPRVVCVSFAEQGIAPYLYDRVSGCLEILAFLRDPEVKLVGHNVAYDLGVIGAELIAMSRDPAERIYVPASGEILRLIFDKYQADLVSDTMIRSMLVDIASGDFQEHGGSRRGKSYSLAVLAERWCSLKLSKTDTWRLHYARLEGVPIADWPDDARDYALLDSVATLAVDTAITRWAIAEGAPSGEIPDTYRQVRAAFVLHLIGGWGVAVDPDSVRDLKTSLLADQKKYHAALDAWGIFKKDSLGNYKRTKKGAIQKDQKRLQELITEGFASRGEIPPSTTRGASTAADVAEASGHPAGIAYAAVASTDKLLSTFVPILERGIDGVPITSSPNVLVASGRTSWTNPNWQNPPRKGGIRECVAARPGTVIIAADLDTVELRALAQACLEIVGHSDMATALHAGMDLHLAVAADIVGSDYDAAKALYDAGDPAISEARQTAKKANFSLPGGVGATKFAQMYLDDGQPLVSHDDGSYDEYGSIQRAQKIKDAWFRTWSEMRQYMQNAGDICGDYGSRSVEQPWSGRVRGGLDYCACANTYFQGRVADGTKLALWRIAYACYVDATSPLFGSRIILFLHDEVIIEAPEEKTHEAGQELARLLVGAVQEVIPDVPITSSAVAMRRWFKGAKPVYVNGRLVPGRPEIDGKGKTIWVPA